MSMPEDFIARLESLRQIMNQQYSKHLRTVVLNGKLDNIDMFAFANCKDLEYIDFPNSIRKIDEFSFCYIGLKNALG